MNFGTLTDDQLDFPFFTDFDENISTLREQLEKIGEDLISVEIDIEDHPDFGKVLRGFLAWSNDSIIALNYGTFHEMYLMKLARNPRE